MDSKAVFTILIGAIKSFIAILLDPINVFWVLVVIFIIVNKTRQTWNQRWLYLALIWLLVTGTRWVPDIMVFYLERQYEVYMPSKRFIGKDVFIQVLGGGGINASALPDQEKLWSTSTARMLEGIRLHRLIPGSKLIFSGSSSTHDVTQARLTKDATLVLGIDSSDIILLEKPSTTEEEALDCREMLDTTSHVLILVTSDIHMPRAMYIFTQAGLNPIAAPADHILKSRCNGNQTLCKKDYWWQSDMGNFQKFSAAIHEYFGLLWARM